jgi:histidinol dehydrogenase
MIISMIKMIKNLSKKQRLQLLERRGIQSEKVKRTVERIVERVKREGDRALLFYSRKFDGVKLNQEELLVSPLEIEAACSKIPKDVALAMSESARNIAEFYKEQKPKELRLIERNGLVGVKTTPLERAGIYVPGGKAAYPSTVLMSAIPAKIAGVKRLVICTPPSSGGSCNPYVLAAASIAGVKEIYKVGGAQAIAAMAYGTKTIPKVDKIVGPGNVFVNVAKRLVSAEGAVAIECPAGPSEVLIIADESAEPRIVAADMLAQAEHDENASAVLVTTSAKTAEKVKSELRMQLKQIMRSKIAGKSLEQNGAVVVVKNMREAIGFANEYAPEHLELLVEKPRKLLPLVKNAGAVFLGRYSPVAAGDYAAGPSHVLPTGGSARAFSGLSVKDFLKESSVIMLSEKGLKKMRKTIAALAQAEGLDAHAAAVDSRFKVD